MNENKQAMPKGVYDCRVTSVVRSTKKGNEQHFILNIGVEPTFDECQRVGVENPATYYVELPMVFVVGQEYSFFDKDKGVRVTRKCVAKDTIDALAYAKRCFPEWEKFTDQLPEGTKHSVAFKWFNGEEIKACVVRASLKEPREYNGKIYYQANLLTNDQSAVADDFDAAFGNSLKAAGVKLGRAKSAGAATASVASVTVAPSVPMPPSAPKKMATREDAWKAYEANCLAGDPGAGKYWDEVAKVVGKDAADQAKFTAEDWQKCVDAFSKPVEAANDNADDMPF